MSNTPTTYSLKIDLELRQRAQSAFPNGVYGHMNAASLSPAHPQFFARAEGGRLWDVDGNEYIDFMCSYGTNLLGHHHPKVDEAARRQQAIADCTTGPSALMLELAETFNNKVAHADWTMFAKNGTDATTICVMTARAQTGRNTVVLATGAYHGANPWCTPAAKGVTEGEKANQITYTYNDVESLKQAVEQAGDDLAAVIVSPFKHDVFEDQEWPTDNFAKTARALCDQKGAALILDDVRCAFRFTTGSTWETIGVLPDLCAMSKSVANGYSLSVVTGNDKFRTGAGEIYVTGSFWFASVSFAASLATIEAIETEGAIDKMHSAGSLLRQGLEELAGSYGFHLRQTGPVQMPLVLFEDDPMWEKNNFFCAEAARRGVYLHPWHNMFVCAAHEERDIREALERIDGAFSALKKQFG
ncbi:aminotransferase class III-fold pyridoxal phosphate-dependent enzyme [Pseudomaricurvus alkylphenolicus]|jgi:glutamate-1-semialdehyde 2,1-aminomutase|uniref:aminotransferase class III-fold pyridoxal phosphate-dependent enzyme n=1 Tax=Pseudomaricurvus alkylphenolicus TaxID=1306991 RepID=UPI0014201CFE|nr:aminotransferase class III-fold pyridoxal phosphate-dependent enzyme [Pseudomaricurvus alkylphenolicus]NIB42982.1 aminotransferase class III-fold pyridoxal phosphate-dependent enzyme [Pseudomaricurvus alkylphenolicus]